MTPVRRTVFALAERLRDKLSDWQHRRTARHRLHGHVCLWYHPAYNPDTRARTARVPHLDLQRSERVLGLLASEGVLPQGAVRAAPLATTDQLLLVHTAAYLERIATVDDLASVFALSAHEVDVDAILLAQRRAVGGSIAAAECARAGQARIAINLGGGLHHATSDSGAGFCVFNDVAIAIRSLRQGGFEHPIAVVDLDFHQGDGTLLTFADDASVLTFSIHGSTWTHVEATADHQVLLPEGTGDEAYLAALRAALPQQLALHAPRMIFYVAGNDVLAGDALGSFSLSLEGVLERDRFVAETALTLGVPLVVTLGGGYSERAWQATANFVRWTLTDESRVTEPSGSHQTLRARFDHIARELDPKELQFDPNSLELTEAELFGELTGRAGAHRLLGYYSKAGVEFALERYGIMQGLRDRGFSDLELHFDPSDPDAQQITIEGVKLGQRHRLVELVLSRRSVRAPAELGGELELLSIDWLLLQDPTREFSLRQPPLPGQSHPGLGMVREVMELLYQACRRLSLDGLVVHPSHYHIAATGGRYFSFLDPEVQGRFDGMQALLRDIDLATASALVDDLAVRDESDQPVPWQATDLVAPLSERLGAYFSSDDYLRLRERARATISHLARAR